ncbi:MAG: DUF1365 domain-containing protein [Desulfobacteraceae bacterium]|jgi:uncharacterized protein
MHDAAAKPPFHRIYEGTIRHRRFHPKENRFQYRVFFMFLDLAHLNMLSGIHPLWSGTGVNLAYFRRRDHMGAPDVSLDRAMRNHVEENTGNRPRGPIRILSHLRYFGHCFNPVSFYYCYDATDSQVETIVAEIHNTPWGQEHLYVLPKEKSIHPSRKWRRHRFDKQFHISPFMDMHLHYDWRFRIPGKQLNVHMINYENGKRLFDASLSLAQKPLTRQNLTRILWLYPAMTVKVVSLIYWQALKLLLKGTPFYTHPAKAGS